VLSEQKKKYNAEYYQKNRAKLLARATARSLECYAANPEKKLASNRAWRASNTERHRAMIRSNYHANLERERARNRNQYEAKPEQAKVRSNKRRAILRQADGSHTAADILSLEKAQSGRCAACKAKFEAGYHVDHITPLIAGGSNYKWNLQLLCGPCNLSKGTKPSIPFMQSRGYLL
jgi:5-methylcytosine-specific restriction endonuclease McrA